MRGVPLDDWVGKRLIGGLNLLLGRSQHFEEAEQKVAALDTLRTEAGIDLVICTGDYTALGTDGGLAIAREAVRPLEAAPLGFVTVPGNHDLYSLDTVREGRFRHHFGGLLTNDLPEVAVDGSPWPLVRLVGDDIAVVAVDSARPNPLPWRSSGRVPAPQLDALAAVLADDRVRDRFVFVITHYAPCRADGSPDRRFHRMVNADAFLATCSGLSRGAILCGHIHERFVAQLPGVRPPVYCAGSATKAGHEGFWVFDVDGSSFSATAGRWSDKGYVLDGHSAAD